MMRKTTYLLVLVGIVAVWMMARVSARPPEKPSSADISFEHVITDSHAPQKRVGFFLNQGKGASWKLQVVARTGSHNIGVVDIDHDGDFDIIGANYDSERDPRGAPMELWRNLLIDHRAAKSTK